MTSSEIIQQLRDGSRKGICDQVADPGALLDKIVMAWANYAFVVDGGAVIAGAILAIAEFETSLEKENAP